jgi:RNA polymerase primary sigma factor
LLDDGDHKSNSLLDAAHPTIALWLRTCQARGYVTYDALNKWLPDHQVSSGDIEATMAHLTDLGIDVVESGPSADL